MNSNLCPLCHRGDALGKPWIHSISGYEFQTCFGLNRPEHSGQRHYFRVDTGEPITVRDGTHLSLIGLLERGRPYEAELRGFPGDFLFHKCGVSVLTTVDIAEVMPDNHGLWSWARGIEQAGLVITMLAIQRGADHVGAQLRGFHRRGGSAQPLPDLIRTLGSAEGIYTPSFTRILPSAIVAHEGAWGAIAATWDAEEYQSQEIFSVAALSASTRPETIQSTLGLIFPGVPRFSVFDQDPAGIKLRERTLEIAKPITISGAGQGKDYRDLIPGLRFERLSEIVRAELKLLGGHQ